VLKTGEDHYNLFCSPCHGDYARGSYLAPRLADKRWYYGGGTDDEVFNIVSRGLPGQLMPAHNVLDEKTRWAVIAYVRSRGGLPNPMALPQARQREVELVK
jgi:mono/diheme cytochrome c family protein